LSQGIELDDIPSENSNCVCKYFRQYDTDEAFSLYIYRP